MKKLSMFVVGLVMIVSLFGCESWERMKKDSQSEYGGGLNRVAIVYDQNGKEIAKYEGKFDVQVDRYGNKIKFDINGKRVLIYNATVVIEEK